MVIRGERASWRFRGRRDDSVSSDLPSRHCDDEPPRRQRQSDRDTERGDTIAGVVNHQPDALQKQQRGV
jgi:hypothetical protein